MDGVDDLDIRPLCETSQGRADPFEIGPKTLTPVRGYDNQPSGCVELRPLRSGQLAIHERIADVEDSVDSRISSDRYLIGWHPFGPKIGGCSLCCGKMKGSQPASQDTVDFLGEGLRRIEGSQPRLDVADGCSGIERSQRPAQGRGRISLYQNEIRPYIIHDRFERGQNPRRGLKQGLAGEHNTEVEVRVDAKGVENLVEQVPVLGGDADRHVKGWVGTETHYERAEFDSFRPRAENEQDFPRGCGAAICGDR